MGVVVIEWEQNDEFKIGGLFYGWSVLWAMVMVGVSLKNVLFGSF
ncbi:MAG: hypothetical protein ACJAUP_002305 [Cellvibrionaceae bacterium]|jgi:hypothetical protein